MKFKPINQYILAILLFCFFNPNLLGQSYEDWTLSLSAIESPKPEDLQDFFNAHMIEFAKKAAQSSKREAKIFEQITPLKAHAQESMIAYFFKRTITPDYNLQDSARTILRFLFLKASSSEPPLVHLQEMIGRGFIKQVKDLVEAPSNWKNTFIALPSHSSDFSESMSDVLGTPPKTAAGQSMHDGLMRLAEVDSLRDEAVKLIWKHISNKNPSGTLETDLTAAAWHAANAFSEFDGKLLALSVDLVRYSQNSLIAMSAIRYLKRQLQKDPRTFDTFLELLGSTSVSNQFKSELLATNFGRNFWEDAYHTKFVLKNKFPYGQHEFISLQEKAVVTFRKELMAIRLFNDFSHEHSLNLFDQVYAQTLLQHSFSLLTLFPNKLPELKKKSLLYELAAWLTMKKKPVAQTLAIELFRAAYRLNPESVNGVGRIDSTQMWTPDLDLVDYLYKTTNVKVTSCIDSFDSKNKKKNLLNLWSSALNHAHSVANQ